MIGWLIRLHNLSWPCFFNHDGTSVDDNFAADFDIIANLIINGVTSCQSITQKTYDTD